MIRVVKRDGRVERLDITKIQKYTSGSVEGLEGVSQSELEVDANLHFRDMISTKDIQQTLIKTAVDKIDIDRPNWTFVAARLFLYDLYHKVGRNVGGVKGKPYFHLKKYFEKGEKEGRILLGLKDKYDLDDLNEYIDPKRDLQFTYLGIKTLYDRYLLKDKNGDPIELPQHLFMGVAMFLAQNEFDCQSWAKKFYDILSKFEVMAATPTLSNARTPRHQLSSCYIGSTPDNIEGIFDAFKEMALLSKFGGGIGWDWSQVRGMGSYIDGHKHAAGGIVPFLKIANDVAIAVDQLGCVAKNSFVRVLDSVETDKFKHDFRKEYQEYFLNKKEIIEIISSHIKNFAFKYGKYTKNDIYELLQDYISGVSLVDICNKFDLSRDQYKKIIGRYKKINKGIPYGFFILKRDSKYAIHKNGVVINLISLKPLSNIIDRKGYVRVALGKKSYPIHKLLVETFFDISEDSDFTIDHIDDNKLNNSLNNFKIISNEDNISKGWIKTKEKRIEMSRIRKHLSHNFRLKGDRRGTEEINIINISTKVIPISEVRIGDLVESFNIELNKVQYKKVEAVHELEVKRENQIKISFENGYIITSKWHPLAIKGKNGYFYKRSDEVEIGDYGINHKGESAKIIAIDNNPNISEEYMDLTVEGTNNYFASTDNTDVFYLTHNTRKGAIAVYIEPWHIDIRDFLDLKKNSGEERRRAHDLFPALWLNDIFMQRVQEDSTWTLFDPYEVSELTDLYGDEFTQRYLELEQKEGITKDVISAKALWKEVLRSYFETGNPFLTFKDSANRANPNRHKGVIRSSNLCVTGDTRLHTQFGLVKAKDLEENYSEILASYDYRTDGDISKLGVGEAKALKMFKTKESADIYEVVTKDGYKIKSTLWHEYYIAKDNKIEKKSLKDISVGDKLLIQSAEGQFGQEGSYDLGFLMGMVTGDGTFSFKESKQHSIVHIELYNQDMNLGNMIHKQIDNVISQYYSRLSNSPKEDFKNIYPKMIQHTKNSQKLRFSNIRLGRIFDEQFNFNAKTKYQVPETIFKGTKETVRGYLQGIFIADGTINKISNDGVPTFAIQLASIKKELLEEIQILLANFGIRSKISKMRDVQDRAFVYTTVDGEYKEYSSKALYRLNINGNNAIKFIDDIGFIGSKQTKALDILAQREKLGYSRYSRKNEKFLVEISEINYIGKEDVYDTTQLYNHSLIFNGLVTGNCTEIFQNTSPNHYKIRVTYSDKSIDVFEEDDLVTTDNGMSKPAKKITALDSINGKQIWMVDKDKTDGQTAVCNLASINLSKIHTPEDIARVVPTAIRMLDNVIDLNFYPLAKVKKTNEATRAIGLGVMGEAQMLAENKIIWGSNEHFHKIDEVMESISYYAIKSSSDLAIEKGKYPEYNGSDWSKGIFPIDKANKEACKLIDRGGLFGYTHDWLELKEKVKTDGMRNGYLMAVAPTSSISILTGTTQAIEPVYKRKWFEENLSGLIPVVVPNLSPDTWQYYIPSYELDQNILVKAGAIRQKWIDQGQSLNIFISLDKASGRYLNEIYMNAWKYGLKSTYYLRSQSPESTNDIEDRSQECVGCQ